MPKARFSLDSIDVESGEQNAFVQSWLEAWSRQYIWDPDKDPHPPPTSPGDQHDDYSAIELAIELIQGTYNPHTHPEPKTSIGPRPDANRPQLW